MYRLQSFLLVLIFLALPVHAFAQQRPLAYSSGSAATAVSVTSASAGVQVVSTIRRGVYIAVATAGAVPVWLFPTDGTCSSTLTTQKGIKLSASTSDKEPANKQFLVTDGWSGQICAILDSGITAVTLRVVTW